MIALQIYFDISVKPQISSNGINMIIFAVRQTRCTHGEAVEYLEKKGCTVNE